MGEYASADLLLGTHQIANHNRVRMGGFNGLGKNPQKGS